MNRPSPGLAATLSHRMGEGLGGRAPFCVGSRAHRPHNVRGNLSLIRTFSQEGEGSGKGAFSFFPRAEESCRLRAIQAVRVEEGAQWTKLVRVKRRPLADGNRDIRAGERDKRAARRAPDNA